MCAIRPIFISLLSVPLVGQLLLTPVAMAQTGSKLAFNVSPTSFRAGQASSTALTVSCVSTVALTISSGDTFTFIFDSSAGSLTSVVAPPSVNSASLSAGDFVGTIGGANQATITYNGQAKPFSYGDTLSLEVAFNAAAKIGTGKISFSSRFTGSVNGSLPYTTVSIEDFANAGVASVIHDGSLTGDGTAGLPLGVSVGGINTTHLASGAVTGAKIANGAAVRSLNGLFDNIALSAGSNITITPGGNTLTIAAPNALTGITHDTTLTGNGTNAAPIGVAIPLGLSGSVSNGAVLSVTNLAEGSNGVSAIGGFGNFLIAGAGVHAEGGVSPDFQTSGPGVEAFGGKSNNAIGGDGVRATGGDSQTDTAGSGATTFGGNSASGIGGDGVFALGGDGGGFSGGDGIDVFAGAGRKGAPDGLAGMFVGDVQVTGNLSKGGGSFKIDHPLDPANKYLYHSFVESPDMMNIYNGNVTTDAAGEAVVTLPDWFDALNRDFRYQLTVIGQFAQAIVADELKDNRFTIRTSLPGVKVSWQVTGIRQDAWANAHRIPVEQDKPERERGYYIHPELFNQPEEKGLEWARKPRLMQQLKEKRERAGQIAQTKNH